MALRSALLIRSAQLEARILPLFTNSHFINHLGITFTSAGEGWVESEVLLKPEEHQQQDGFIHAGVITTIADHTGGGAAFTTSKPGQVILTSSIHINFLRPGKGNILRSFAHILKPGRTQLVVESSVYARTVDLSLVLDPSQSNFTSKQCLTSPMRISPYPLNYLPSSQQQKDETLVSKATVQLTLLTPDSKQKSNL